MYRPLCKPQRRVNLREISIVLTSETRTRLRVKRRAPYNTNTGTYTNTYTNTNTNTNPQRRGRGWAWKGEHHTLSSCLKTSCDSGCSPFVFKIIVKWCWTHGDDFGWWHCWWQNVLWATGWWLCVTDSDATVENDDSMHLIVRTRSLCHTMMTKMTNIILMTKLMTKTLERTRNLSHPMMTKVTSMTLMTELTKLLTKLMTKLMTQTLVRTRNLSLHLEKRPLPCCHTKPWNILVVTSLSSKWSSPSSVLAKQPHIIVTVIPNIQHHHTQVSIIIWSSPDVIWRRVTSSSSYRSSSPSSSPPLEEVMGEMVRSQCNSEVDELPLVLAPHAPHHHHHDHEDGVGDEC